MPRRTAITTLDASTADILNVIRANASAEYQQYVPTVQTENDIPKVGEVLYGYPALANQFINALMNRIALVQINSITFNNEYAELKKGFLEFGETVEEVFVNITKAREFSAEKAAAREFKRSLADVRSAFHIMNYRAQYPITIQNEDLRMAFTSFSGVEDMIARIVGAVNSAAEYDEYLLFKYLLIKGITHGKLYPVKVGATLTDSAVKFRGTSNAMLFPSTRFNLNGVHNVTAKEDQYIFMSTDFNAQFDVNVLASAFNMDKADFMGHLKLIDDWTTFDNDRFSEIMSGSNQISLVTSEELTLMEGVQAVLVGKEWFQIYDNLTQMSEQYVASGLYWNYFYNVWKTVSSSPFSNAVVFVASTATTTLPETITLTVKSIEVANSTKVVTLAAADGVSLVGGELKFVQTRSNTENGIGVEPYGAYLFDDPTQEADIRCLIGTTEYNTETKITAETAVGDTITVATS